MSLVVAVIVAAAAWLDPRAEDPSENPESPAASPPAPEIRGTPAAPLTTREDPAGSAQADTALVPAERSGVALFPPPGTEPLKRGLIVPEDFELPPGYVRHFQTTDDGQRVPPILMFHPDYRPVGPDGKPIPLPPDRVVPPELAPPGFPIEQVVHPGDVHRETR
ncbi:MAG TPA: hypothetical protein VE549_09900 [Myxococcaceae bacterium]|nr:hypothetical protein [Myxococcaceae bacterium]